MASERRQRDKVCALFPFIRSIPLLVLVTQTDEDFSFTVGPSLLLLFVLAFSGDPL